MEDASAQATGNLRPATRRRNVVFGGLLIVGGIVLFVNRLTVFQVGALWPLFFLGVGIAKLASACCNRQRRTGTAIIGLGLWFALNEFTYLSYHDTWPLLLLLWGGLLIWDGIVPASRCPVCEEGRRGH
jgi:hypothetical protein